MPLVIAGASAGERGRGGEKGRGKMRGKGRGGEGGGEGERKGEREREGGRERERETRWGGRVGREPRDASASPLAPSFCNSRISSSAYIRTYSGHIRTYSDVLGHIRTY